MQTHILIVTGPPQSGKSTFIATLCPQSVVRFRVGDIHYSLAAIPVSGGRILYLIEMPGTANMEEMLAVGSPIDFLDYAHNLAPDSTLWSYVVGMVVLVNSAKPATFREAASILGTCRANAEKYKFSVVTAANHQDEVDAWELEDLQVALRLHQHDRLFKCVGVEKDLVKQIVQDILQAQPTTHEDYLAVAAL